MNTQSYLLFTDSEHLELLAVLNCDGDIIESNNPPLGVAYHASDDAIAETPRGTPEPVYKGPWLSVVIDYMKQGVYARKAGNLPVVLEEHGPSGRMVEGKAMTLADLIAPVGSKPQAVKRKAAKRIRRTKPWWLKQAAEIQKRRSRSQSMPVIAEALGVSPRVLAANIARHSLLTAI